MENLFRQKDQQLCLVEETEVFLRSALARAEEKIEEEVWEIEYLWPQVEKLRRMLFDSRSEKLRHEVEQAETLLHNGFCRNYIPERIIDVTDGQSAQRNDYYKYLATLEQGLQG